MDGSPSVRDVHPYRMDDRPQMMDWPPSLWTPIHKIWTGIHCFFFLKQNNFLWTVIHSTMNDHPGCMDGHPKMLDSRPFMSIFNCPTWRPPHVSVQFFGAILQWI